MYNSEEKTLDIDLTELSFNQTINIEFTVEQILNNSLWYIKEENDDLLTVIPLFNCDIITSNNPKDIILDNNKMLILQNKNDTIITCTSNDTGNIHYQEPYHLHAYTAYSKLDVINQIYVYCIVYDENLNPIINEEVNYYINSESYKTKTNNQGLCKISITEPCTVSFEYENIQSEEITIGE